MSTLELAGLKGHHPLGFLAACGVLRCCGGIAGGRKIRLAWKQANDSSGWVAVLHRRKGFESRSLVRLLIRQARRQRDSAAMNWSSKIDDCKKYRAVGLSLGKDPSNPRDQEALAVLAALASDIVSDGKNKLRATFLDLTSAGQGLLKNIHTLSKDLSMSPKRAGQLPPGAAAFEEALFGPWRYRDNAHSLGWDPQTQRLHALRHKLPTKDKENRSVRGAVFLGSQALPLFPCFALNGRLRTTGFHQDGGDAWFAWPIWREPISLDTLSSLLAHPLNRDLKRRGVEVVYRCRRVHTGGPQGNFQIFSNSEERPWTIKGRQNST